MGLVEYLRELGEEAEGCRCKGGETAILRAFLVGQEQRDTERIALERNFWSNNILSGGSRALDSGLRVHLRFRVPYAWLWVSDPFSQGPLWIANADDPLITEEIGAGRWQMAAGADGVVPLYGDELTIYAPEGTAGQPICVTAFARPFTGSGT